jgi:hypothetical protein
MLNVQLKYLLAAGVGILVILFSSCKEDEMVDPADYTCKRLPLFITSTGLNPGRSAFSTSEQRTMGLVLKEFPEPNSNAQPKIYQHPSWKTGGWLSPIQVDGKGDIYTAPAAFVNLLVNPLNKRNTLYKVNSTDGIMSEFMNLPIPDTNDRRNPYGILSLAFNCKRNILYVSSVAGSTPQQEKGCIYAIDLETKKIIDKAEGKDFFGIQVVVANDKLWLLAGSTRNGDIFSIKIKPDGSFGGNAEKIASIEGLGARGDDKVKKIIFKSADNIQVKGLEFNYNLIAPTEKQESSYDFYFDSESQTWMFKN